MVEAHEVFFAVWDNDDSLGHLVLKDEALSDAGSRRPVEILIRMERRRLRRRDVGLAVLLSVWFFLRRLLFRWIAFRMLFHPRLSTTEFCDCESFGILGDAGRF